ncbi:MAG: hypothetical protein Q4C70_13250, partial [Planctomycetia bacterium]|nr:hypothetical protein [Planctomycetia bacterium]
MKFLSETTFGRAFLLGIVTVLASAFIVGDCSAQFLGGNNRAPGLLRRRATVTPLTPQGTPIQQPT